MSARPYGQIIPCSHCAGEGRTETSKYGGNDPDVWFTGECAACQGSGNQVCEYCGKTLATVEWTDNRGKTYLVCKPCSEEE